MLFNLFRRGKNAEFNSRAQSQPQTESASQTPTANCPNCAKALPKFPSRKAKCPFCSSVFFVRTDPFTRKRLVLSESQLADNEKAWQKYGNISEFKRALTEASGKDFDSLFVQVKNRIRAEFDREPSESDVLWAVSNSLVAEAIKKHKTDLIQQIHWAQSVFLCSHGKDYSYIRQADFKTMLLEYKRDSVVRAVSITTAKDSSCDYCKKLEGKRFSIDEALQEKPLPCKQCTFGTEDGSAMGWCRCTYVPEVD